MAHTPLDVAACQALRHVCFYGCAGLDADAYDPEFEHVMIERGDTLVGTLRLRVLPDGADFSQTYTGSFYDFGPISGPTLEVGRFCLKGDGGSLDILQQAWASITRLVDLYGVTHLFGCASFQGSDPALYGDAFAQLHHDHQGKIKIAPKSFDCKELSEICADPFDPKRAFTQTPQLLRTYLGFGGFVSDHLVFDRILGTMHVFIGIEIAAIPEARAKSLRRMVAQTEGLHNFAPRTS